jgi:hypothetical protein
MLSFNIVRVVLLMTKLSSRILDLKFMDSLKIKSHLVSVLEIFFLTLL